jgi:hypothetical protein
VAPWACHTKGRGVGGYLRGRGRDDGEEGVVDMAPEGCAEMTDIGGGGGGWRGGAYRGGLEREHIEGGSEWEWRYQVVNVRERDAIKGDRERKGCSKRRGAGGRHGYGGGWGEGG